MLLSLVIFGAIQIDPPIVGRPVDFSGAVGGPYIVTMSVEPTIVTPEEPMTLTLSITGPGNLASIARPALGKLPGFQPFAVDDLDDSFSDGTPPTRTFHYRLRARLPSSTQIPPVRFVYFNPAIVPPSRGYQTTYAEGFRIRVETTRLTPEHVPDFIRREWQHRSEFDSSSTMSWMRSFIPRFLGIKCFDNANESPISWIVALSLPPVLCLFWFLVWRTQSNGEHNPGSSWCVSLVEILFVLALCQTPDRTGSMMSHGFQALHDAFQSLSEKRHRPIESLQFFREAAICLEAGKADYGEDPDTLRWLGHARLLSQDVAGAIVAYRRGLLLDPNDERLHTALSYARSQVEYQTSEMRPRIGSWPSWLSLHRCNLLAFCSYTVAWLALTRWWMVRRRIWLALAVFGIVVAVIPAIGTLLEWHERARNEETPVVVLARETELRRGNGDIYPPRLDSPLSPGVEATKLFERGSWLQVELANGVVGWLPVEAVIPVSRGG